MNDADNDKKVNKYDQNKSNWNNNNEVSSSEEALEVNKNKPITNNATVSDFYIAFPHLMYLSLSPVTVTR